MLTYTHKVNKSFVHYVILTSSTHCMCCSLLAMSRAVSPAEFTTGQSEQWKAQNQDRLIDLSIYLPLKIEHSLSVCLSIYLSSRLSIHHVHCWICVYVSIVYLCVKQLLLWAEVSSTLICCIMHSNEALCFLLLSSFPGSHWENTHKAVMDILLGCWRICDNSRCLSPVLSKKIHQSQRSLLRHAHS